MKPTADSRPSEANTTRSFDWRWLLPVAPWLWFVFRSIHPLLDFVAIALPVLLLIAVALIGTVALLCRSPIAAVTTVSLILLFLVAVIAPMRPASAAEPSAATRIASMNLGLLFFSDNDAGFFVFEEEPDLLVGSELAVSHDAEFQSRFEFHETDIIPLERQQQNEQGLQPEGDSFRQNGLPSIGVYSNLPLTRLEDPLEGTIDGGLPGFRLRVDAEPEPFILYALHVPRPFPGDGVFQVSASEHVEIVDAVIEAIAAETEPVVVVGDLNSVDRGQAYRTWTGELDDAMRQSGWAVPTWDRRLPWSLLFARIDHVLISPQWCATNGASHDTRFADHRPLIAEVGPCAN